MQIILTLFNRRAAHALWADMDDDHYTGHMSLRSMYPAIYLTWLSAIHILRVEHTDATGVDIEGKAG